MEYFAIFMIIGAIIGSLITLFVTWIRLKNIEIKWYEWLMGAIALILLLIGIQHLFGATAELYTFAAWIGGLIFLLPAIILLVVCWQLIYRRERKS